MALFGKKTPKLPPVATVPEIQVPDIDPSFLRKNGISLLSIDERWTALFSGRTLPPVLTGLQTEMSDLLRRQASLRQEQEQLEPAKKRAMQHIMLMTKEAFENGNEAAKASLKQSRDEIERLNLRWSTLLEETENVELSLRQANVGMLKATAAHVFSTMRQAQSRLPVLTDEIRSLEEELDRKKVERDSLALDWESLSEPFSRLYGTDYVQTLETFFSQDIQLSKQLLLSLRLKAAQDGSPDEKSGTDGQKGGAT